MRAQYVAVQDVLDIFDTNRIWYYIPGFRGYEVSNDGYLRSMKHYLKYPYGILIQSVKREPYINSSDPMFELSDDNNKRRRIRLSQIIHLAATNQYGVSGYPRSTIITDLNSRNHWVKDESGNYVKVYNGPKKCKNPFKVPLMDNTVHYPKFTVIQDGTEMPFMYYSQPDIRVPLTSIKGDEYYGRKDCRTLCNPDVRTGPIEIQYNRK